MAGTIITKKGVALMAKLLASRQGLTFTRAAVGVGSTPSGYDPASMINLNKYKMDGEISGYTVGEEEASVVFQISSENVQEGFTITEAGLFADDEDEGEILYAYLDLTDDPQYVYARGGAIQKFAEIEFKTIIGTIENVTAVISPTVLITREQFDAGMETKVDAEGGDIANTKVSAATESTDPYPAPTAKETMKVILGKLIKFCADVKTGMCKIEDIVNNCTSTDTDKPLAAAIGKKLWDKITETVSALAAHKTSGDHDGRYYTETEMDSKLGGKSNTGHTHDDRYYTETEVDNKLSGKSDTNHSHDSRYYTESEMDTKLNGKANSSHTHDDRYYTESEMNTKLSGKSDTSHGHSGMLTTSDIVNNCTSTATNKPLAAAQGKVLMDKYNQLNSDLAWMAITFTPSSTYISGGDGFGYRMGQICICSLAVKMKKIPAWSDVVIGRVSLQSHMYCLCVANLQSTGKTVQLYINNGSGGSDGYDIHLETFNQEVPTDDWLRGFLIYFH